MYLYVRLYYTVAENCRITILSHLWWPQIFMHSIKQFLGYFSIGQSVWTYKPHCGRLRMKPTDTHCPNCSTLKDKCDLLLTSVLQHEPVAAGAMIPWCWYSTATLLPTGLYAGSSSSIFGMSVRPEQDWEKKEKDGSLLVIWLHEQCL